MYTLIWQENNEDKWDRLETKEEVLEKREGVPHKNYSYEHYIPLNANDISCQNAENVSFAQYGENLVLNLTNYITADF